MKIVAAFDTSASQTGYVKGATDRSAPLLVSSFSLDKRYSKDIGQQCRQFRDIVEPIVDGVDLVFMEQPLVPRGGVNFNTLQTLYGISAILQMVCVEKGITCIDIKQAKHKKVIYDHGGPKPLNAVEYAQAWGIDAKNADEADAAGVFLGCVSELMPEDFRVWQAIRAESPPIQRITKPKKAPKKKKNDDTLI